VAAEQNLCFLRYLLFKTGGGALLAVAKFPQRILFASIRVIRGQNPRNPKKNVESFPAFLLKPRIDNFQRAANEKAIQSFIRPS
jgi:hypothetical protein